MSKRAQPVPERPAAAAWTAWYLYLSVFLSGGSILVVEVAAGRVLAPHFGNTLYTWTSMIGIILAALSVGYALGGRLADRNPSARTFFLLMLAGAALTALVPPLRALVLPAMEDGLSIRSGPIFGGLLLFAAPSLVLAMLTPFAVKLRARNERTLGTVTGDLFTWSTVGSIAGTFATGFVFIPWFGLNSIFLATALALALAAGAGLWLAPRMDGGASPPGTRGARTLVGLCALALAGGAAATPYPPGVGPDNVFFRENMYHTIRVNELNSNGQKVRELFLDYQPEGAMVVGDDSAFHFGYTRFLSLGPVLVPGMKSAFFLGGGAFTMPKALHLLRPETRITVAELDPDVVKTGRRFFHLARFPGIRVRVGDGRRLLHAGGHKWDFIVGDAYRGLRSIPPHLVTREFFADVRERLAPGGVFMMNLIAKRAGPGHALYSSVYRTLRAVFPDVWIFSTDPGYPMTAQNILLFAFREADPGRFARLTDRLEHDPKLAFAASARVAPPGPRDFGPVLTDDYNPVDYLIEQSF